MVQNIHAHVWDQALHMTPETIKETDVSRGFRLDLTTKFDVFMKDCEVFDRVIVFGMKARKNGYWVPDDYVADFVKRAGSKLVGFACCDPNEPGYFEDLQRGIEELGMVGVKMGPMYAGFDPRDRRLVPVYEYLQRNGLPVLFHSGTTFNSKARLAETRPWLFDDVAIEFPELRMILAHVGHPFCEECLVVIRKHPHVYADISALYYRPWQFYNMLIAAQEYKVTHKLLFGTDYPFTMGQDSIDALKNANHIIAQSGLPRVTDETVNGILDRDAFALLEIE